jgi:hypothetical protein
VRRAFSVPASARTRAFVLAVLAGATISACGGKSQRAEAQNAPPEPHIVSVSFDYDFQKSPPCTVKNAPKKCVKQFNVYDVSGGRFKLFSIPVPDDAKGVVKDISGKSPQRKFEPGTHFIAVTAENMTGEESDVNVAKTSLEIKPAAAVGH